MWYTDPAMFRGSNQTAIPACRGREHRPKTFPVVPCSNGAEPDLLKNLFERTLNVL